MNLTETPDFVTWPETHYVFVEKTGSIPTIAPLTWQALNRLIRRAAFDTSVSPEADTPVSA